MEYFKEKKIILAIPQSFSLHEAFIKQLESLGLQIIDISYIVDNFKYKNLQQRLYNSFRKLFLKDYEYKNTLKAKLAEDKIQKALSGIDKVDYALFIRPDFYTFDIIEKVKKIADKTVGYQWDGLNRFPNAYSRINLFERFFVFDPEDLRASGTLPITNFYFDYSLDENGAAASDVFFLATYIESRMEEIYKFFNTVNLLSLNVNALIYTTKEEIADYVHKVCPSLKVITNTIPYDSNLKLAKRSNIIIDFAHNIHNGLSLRVFEAIGYDKKLITTNKFVRDYDFYNPANILVLEDEYTPESIKEFIEIPYEPLDSQVKEKYGFTNWIKYLFNIEGHIPIELPVAMHKTL
ncbi:hypothetical protein [Sphingobacterium gobiense]|uniref:Lipopolysaccharide biosynthesis protein n=1 Tax=Sphingobacterium gobiense TaxID=1382456 RepID=A0A2S9JMP6_9SPHI|nr:hypothetical protein [Sphingobacterium gobiense]PRD54427.1 hypothetical protein C5749_13275 [Sphingobacterium gobiense]